MFNVTIQELEAVATKRGVPVYVVFDEIMEKLLAQLN